MIRRRLLGDGSVVAVRDGKAPRKAPRFWYKDAERGMPVEVRMALARFRQLPEKIRGQVVAWGWLLGPGATPKLKFDPADVDFGPPPPDKMSERCHNCVHFFRQEATGVQICALVKGAPISPIAWCSRWAKAISAKAFIAYQWGDK